MNIVKHVVATFTQITVLLMIARLIQLAIRFTAPVLDVLLIVSVCFGTAIVFVFAIAYLALRFSTRKSNLDELPVVQESE